LTEKDTLVAHGKDGGTKKFGLEKYNLLKPLWEEEE
jgi:hypothetical protein